MPDYIEPLDFKRIFLDLFLGHPSVVAFASVLIISVASAKMQLSNRNFIIVLMITSLLLAGYTGEAIYIIILSLLGFVIWKSMSRAFV